MLIGGYLIQWIGFDPVAAEEAGGLSEAMSQRMLLMLMICQGGGLAIAIVVFFFYPITRKRAEQTRAKLEARRGTTCAGCGYHLRTISSTCPECGAPHQ